MSSVFGIPASPRVGLTVAGDAVVLLASLYLAHWLRFPEARQLFSLPHILSATTGASTLFLGTHLLALYLADTYSPAITFRRPVHALRLAAASLVAFIAMMAAFQALPTWQFGRGITALGTGFGFLGITLWRSLGARWLHRVTPTRPLILVGHGPAADRLRDRLQQRDDAASTWRLLPVHDAPQAQTALTVQASAHPSVEVVVANPASLSPSQTHDLMKLRAEGVPIHDLPTFFARLTGRIPAAQLDARAMLLRPVAATERVPARTALRLLDVVAAALGLVLTLPLVATAALLIRLTSQGPAVYRQVRLGQHRQPFTLYKLRTMVQDAEAQTGAVWSEGPTDPRVTPVGRLLRRSRIDELPQLLNVLRGEMTLVGPRPERPPFVSDLEAHIPYYGLRFAVKPGLTGWAQVNHPYGNTVAHAEAKLEYELYAIEHMSPALYLLIVLKTARTVVRGGG